jgi:hypothetical protein
MKGESMNPNQKNYYAMTEMFNSVPIPGKPGQYTFSASRTNWLRVVDWLNILIGIYVPPLERRDMCVKLRTKILTKLEIPSSLSSERYIVFVEDDTLDLIEGAIAYICYHYNREAWDNGNTALRP